jgi:hypothetical protein
MHAIVIHANISDLAEARRGLREEVIPMMKGAPGFLGAHFIAVDDAHGVSIQLFETEEQARAAAPPEGSEAPGVKLASLEFGEVIGSA